MMTLMLLCVASDAIWRVGGGPPNTDGFRTKVWAASKSTRRLICAWSVKCSSAPMQIPVSSYICCQFSGSDVGSSTSATRLVFVLVSTSSASRVVHPPLASSRSTAWLSVSLTAMSILLMSVMALLAATFNFTAL